MEQIEQRPRSESHRLVPVSSAEIRAGVAPGSWLLVVSGRAPYLDMSVTLEPAVYIRQPEYWRIEVVGVVPGGIGLTAVKDYTVALSLSGVVGTCGVEVVGKDYCERLEVPPVTAERSGRIYQVGKVTLGVQESMPPRLLITAQGIASTPGWGNPRLEPLADNLAPDGYAEFEFVADPPEGPIIQVLSPISASLSWAGYGELRDRVKGVRVSSSTNEVSAPLRDEPTPTPGYQEIVKLAQGETVAVDGGSLDLELTEVNDSRCPADASCVWAGFVAVTIRARPRGGDDSSVTLSSRDEEPVTLRDGHILRLVDVVPYPGTGVPDDTPQVAHVMVMRM